MSGTALKQLIYLIADNYCAQTVKFVQSATKRPVVSSIEAPQGTVLATFLFTLYVALSNSDSHPEIVRWHS